MKAANLNFTIMWSNITAWDSFIYKLRRNLCLGSANILLAEQELPVQVGQVYGIHVYHSNLSKPHESKVLQEFATQPSGSDHKYLTVLQEELQYIRRRIEGCRSKRSSTLQDLTDMGPASWPVNYRFVNLHFVL